MGKGRRSVPSTADEGNWFRHRGEPGDAEGRLRDRTSTKDMLEAPFSAQGRPRPPPVPFNTREEVIYKDLNPFTQHDNRHYFQEHGVYLGNGRDTRTLGRRLQPVDTRLHHTDTGYLHHRSRTVNPAQGQDYSSITATCFTAPAPTEAPARRRFQRSYTNTDNFSRTTTTDWHKDTPADAQTRLGVLAASQEPFLPHNSWQYSYKGPHAVYPPYDRKPFPKVPNVLNRYVSDFGSSSPAVRVD